MCVRQINLYTLPTAGAHEGAYFPMYLATSCCAELRLIQRQTYEVKVDGFNGMKRLDLYRFDGSPMNPMWLAYNPPQMLPTITLNPTTAASTGGAKPTGGAKSRRDLDENEEFVLPLNRRAIHERAQGIDADKWWWIGVGITALGGVGYFCF